MLRRYCHHLSLLLLLLPILGSNATCPYDLDSATPLIPATCYANATDTAAGSTTTGCCWFVFAAYIYAAIRHANHTVVAFLPDPAASDCASAFSASLIRRGLVRPSLLNSSDSCNLSGDLAAGKRPCLYTTVSAIRSAVNLSNATRLCATFQSDLSTNQSACADCQNAVVGATFDLLNITNSKEFVPCGMAATIGIWSPAAPPLPRFRSYALCMLQILENVGSLGTSNLLPSPPPPRLPSSSASPIPPSSSSSRSIKIAAGSAAAGVASIAAIVFLAVLIHRSRRRRSTDNDADRTVTIGSPLPTDGLYIFTKAELRQATGGYDDRLLLGEGGAGRVYLGKLPSGQPVAIKRIYREKKLPEFYREVEILAKLRHRNLTTLVGYCLGSREHSLVYEYMAGGNLSRALFHGELTWHRRVRIAVDVSEGLAYLHDFPEGAVVHRDVKPTNVLLTESGVAKLSDFGVSRIVPTDGTHVSTEVRGTMGYVDPDSFSVGHVSEASDVYSFGVVLLELVTGTRAVVPTPTGGAESIVHKAQEATTRGGSDGDGGVGSIVDPRLGEWDRASVGAAFKLACRCVRPYKNERPQMTEVLVVLKRILADLEARLGLSGDVVSSGPSTEEASEESWVRAWSL
ncbi:proline-rich receptor-like protein kinase PERK3 [Phoenix dactylifera]|uniref:Proline-rich receptor-like protein kinase PERK3 n=1 Tax=Phoenix dactylifera TaxID=42345 RepID=A0A8B8JAB2_PHODC|nr:proline-rich receptor-like protein kinase PERK3 [Phoenix dactylifera]